jgi:hypothetical protein
METRFGPDTNRAEIVEELAKRDGFQCYLCDAPFTQDNLPTIDHVWPLSKGGGWDRDNLKLACRSCNQDKGNRVFVDGNLEPKHRKIGYRERKANKQAAIESYCELCYSGRLLLEDETCPECLRGSVPWSWQYKLKPSECPHSGRFWCWMDASGIIDRQPAIVDVLNGDVEFDD